MFPEIESFEDFEAFTTPEAQLASLLHLTAAQLELACSSLQ